ncbi:MAG: MBL fold metallo-hydrolase [Candidatus Deferrimicrobiaceae bacterium]
MECIVLGSGTAVPHPRRGSAGYMVRHAGCTLLVDAGLGTLQKLAVLGVSPAEPEAVAFTHLHLDHTAELAPLLFSLRNPGIGRRKALTLLGAPGFRDFYERLRQVYGSWVEGGEYPLLVKEIFARPVSLGSLHLTATPVSHTPESVAFRVEDPETGKVIAISGDTDVCPGLVESARNADAAFFECSFPNERKVGGHLTPGEAGEVAAEARVKKLILTHFYPECEGSDILGQCRETFSGEVILAEDLLRVSV